MSVISAKPRSKPLRTQQNALMRTMTGLLDRMKLAGLIGQRFGGARDYYDVFGYKKTLSDKDLAEKYARQDVAARIIDAPPEATWSDPPEMDGRSRLKKAWDEFIKQHNIWPLLERADRLSRMGYFSLLLVGTDKTALPMRAEGKVIYLRPVGSACVDIERFVVNTSDPRFGKPEMYKVKFEQMENASYVAGTKHSFRTKDVLVHYSHALHIVENPLDDEVLGIPILMKVFNVLDDLVKVAGGTAETYWLTANRGLHANVDKEMDLDPADAEDLADEVQEYIHQLSRIIKTRGVDVQVLDSKTPDPKATFEMIMSLLSGATGIPKRILLGAEAGQLASEQDRANWAERIQERRKMFAEPIVLDPFVRMLQACGQLPADEQGWKWKWPEAFHVSPLERAQTMAAQARAVGNLSRQTGNSSPMQITSQEEAREIIGLEGRLSDEEQMFTMQELHDMTIKEADAKIEGMQARTTASEDDEGEDPDENPFPRQTSNPSRSGN